MSAMPGVANGDSISVDDMRVAIAARPLPAPPHALGRVSYGLSGALRVAAAEHARHEERIVDGAAKEGGAKAPAGDDCKLTMHPSVRAYAAPVEDTFMVFWMPSCAQGAVEGSGDGIKNTPRHWERAVLSLNQIH